MKSGIVRRAGYVTRTGGAHVCIWEIWQIYLRMGVIKVEFKEIGCG
jgi:hypothetical protein